MKEEQDRAFLQQKWRAQQKLWQDDNCRPTSNDYDNRFHHCTNAITANAITDHEYPDPECDNDKEEGRPYEIKGLVFSQNGKLEKIALDSSVEAECESDVESIQSFRTVLSSLTQSQAPDYYKTVSASAAGANALVSTRSFVNRIINPRDRGQNDYHQRHQAQKLKQLAPALGTVAVAAVTATAVTDGDYGGDYNDNDAQCCPQFYPQYCHTSPDDTYARDPTSTSAAKGHASHHANPVSSSQSHSQQQYAHKPAHAWRQQQSSRLHTFDAADDAQSRHSQRVRNPQQAGYVGWR